MWTHKYVLAATHNLPDKADTAARLMANQAELASATLPEPGAEHLKALLEDHIKIAVQIVSALLAGNQDAPPIKEWQANADDIARYLAQNGIGNFEANQHMMQMHLDLLTKEVMAIIARNPKDQIKYLDASVNEALEMASSMC
jgi:hypothetical protein